MASPDNARAINEAVWEQLSDPGMRKNAADSLTDFTRDQVREEGVYRQVIPMIEVSNGDLDQQVDTDGNVIVCEMEPDSPGAVSVPFATLPVNWYIRGRKYRVMFSRVMSSRFQKDISELRTYRQDIRQLVSDNSLKDILAEEDSKFFTAVNAALVAADTIVPYSGVIQWETVHGGISRDTLEEAFKIMEKTPGHLTTNTVVVNNVTLHEIRKWGRDEVGGDHSQDMLMKGWAGGEFMGVEWIVTIKRYLVPDDTIYMFADPRFIGKSMALEDVTMYVNREAFMIEFFNYEEIGGAIAATNGIARADFA